MMNKYIKDKCEINTIYINGFGYNAIECQIGRPKKSVLNELECSKQSIWIRFLDNRNTRHSEGKSQMFRISLKTMKIFQNKYGSYDVYTYTFMSEYYVQAKASSAATVFAHLEWFSP